jgi:acyl-CoA synthetase (AMP-forming)/AMP-acid ligase II
MIVGRDADAIWREHGRSASCPSLPAWLARRAAATPDRPAVTFVDYTADPDGVPATVTFAELDRRVNVVAAHLAGLVTRDERVAILAPQGIDYVVGFLGVLRAGAIAVPLFSPDLPGHAQRLSAVLADCEPACVLAVRANAKLVCGFAGAQPGRRRQVVVTIDEIGGGPPPSFTPPADQLGRSRVSAIHVGFDPCPRGCDHLAREHRGEHQAGDCRAAVRR